MSKHKIRVLCFDNKRVLLSRYTAICIDFEWEREKKRDTQWKIIRLIKNKTGDKMNTNKSTIKVTFYRSKLSLYHTSLFCLYYTVIIILSLRGGMSTKYTKVRATQCDGMTHIAPKIWKQLGNHSFAGSTMHFIKFYFYSDSSIIYT